MHGGKSLCDVWKPQKVVNVDTVRVYFILENIEKKFNFVDCETVFLDRVLEARRKSWLFL